MNCNCNLEIEVCICEETAEEPPDHFLERRLQEIGEKWDLHYRNDNGNTVGQQPHDPFPTEATRRAYGHRRREG